MAKHFQPDDLIEIERDICGMAGRQAAVHRQDADGHYVVVEIAEGHEMRLWHNWMRLIERDSDVAKVALVTHG